MKKDDFVLPSYALEDKITLRVLYLKTHRHVLQDKTIKKLEKELEEWQEEITYVV